MIRNVLRTILFRSFSGSIKSEVRVVKNIPVIIALITIIIPILAGVTYAGVRLVVPDQDPYAPIYADYYGNEDFVAVFFYRNPSCVPGGFDLWGEFFDPPDAFGCPLTVKGFVIYENLGDFAPKQAKIKGLGEVPIWFVSLSDYQDAINAGSVTVGDIEGMASLQVGYASFYTEVLHAEGHPEMPMKNIKASGTMEDGRSFLLHSVWVGSWPTPVHSHMTILFK